MKRLKIALLGALCAVCFAACGGSSGSSGGNNNGGGDNNGGGNNSGGNNGGGNTDECAKQANVDKAAALTAAQPAFAVKVKTVITAQTTFVSVAGDSAVKCPVTLKFKDLNGNGSLDVYEDWTRTPAERAADLVSKMTAAEKAALMVHAETTDAPKGASPALATATQALVDAGVRFGRTAAGTSQLAARAAWANALQSTCEASKYGIPFVLSMSPSHTTGNGQTAAAGFSEWPQQLGLAASNDPAVVKGFGQVAAQEFRAIGVRMALSPSADLFTDPRWINGQFTFGEDSAQVAAMVKAYIEGFQGSALGANSVACVVSSFPGAGAATGGFDARLAKGKYLSFSGTSLDSHLAPFEKAIAGSVAGVMPSYGVLKTGSWSGLGGLVDGTKIEQVGASFNAALLTDVLRGHYAFGGVVVAPAGVLEDPGTSPLGAPWGLETSSKAQRAAKAVSAGVDQFAGVNDPKPITDAKAAGLLTDAQIDKAAQRLLTLVFQMGLFENPYVDAAKAPSLCGQYNADGYVASLKALDGGLVLLVNKDKPAGFVNGSGDGTQTGDAGNAGNGSGKVLPAPPGIPYQSKGARWFLAGDFDLDYARNVKDGYGSMLMNDATACSDTDPTPVSTDAQKIACSDYVFIRIAAPSTLDPDSGPLGYPTASLQYAGASNASALQTLANVRSIIDAAKSKTQIVVDLQLGRPSVVSEIMSYGVSGLYVEWGSGMYTQPDKNFLDVAFGVVNGTGVLPVGLPASDAAAAAQAPDLPKDGQDPVFVKGFGLTTATFF